MIFRYSFFSCFFFFFNDTATTEIYTLSLHDALPISDLAPERFVYCISNHDQVGNRAFGDRLNQIVSPASYRAASGFLLLSPYTPMLFMGQEWAACSPFCYFTDHEPQLGRNVTEGRRKEFAQFSEFRDPA